MDTEESHDGKTPSQWFTRLLGLTIIGGGIAAVVASWNDIRRYVRIERM